MTGSDDGERGEKRRRERGLDAGLAKSAPDAAGLTSDNYKSHRRRLELFDLQCKRRAAIPAWQEPS